MPRLPATLLLLALAGCAPQTPFRRLHDVGTLVLAYSFAGTILGINYAGTGARTYIGAR